MPVQGWTPRRWSDWSWRPICGTPSNAASSWSTTLLKLKQLGIELAIDDFGTGYSSLSYLNRFPVDAVKIDRSFVSQIGTSTRDTTIIRAIVALAKSSQLSITAEGIESAEQLREIGELGCNRGQGYLLAKPQPPEAIPALLAAHYEARPPAEALHPIA